MSVPPSESDLLQHIYNRSASITDHPHIIVGPGDDAAVVDLGAQTILTVDQLVEDRHYTPDTAIDLIARKAIARNISDIAAMGGMPRCALAAATLRRSFKHADHLFDRMAHWAAYWNAPLVGGDIAIHDGPTVLSVTVIGVPRPARSPVLRSTARPGDLLCTTGKLGNAFHSGRHLSFLPRLRESHFLCDLFAHNLTAMIDISDGLGIDAARLATASGIRIDIDASALPLNPDCTDWRNALSDGEDYELLFTITPDHAHKLSADTPDTPITIIGRVSDGDGCFITSPEGESLDASSLGWNHA